MTEELAFLLGAYAAEGHTSRSNWTITITNSVDSVLERVVAAWQSEFGVTARIARDPGKCPAVTGFDGGTAGACLRDPTDDGHTACAGATSVAVEYFLAGTHEIDVQLIELNGMLAHCLCER